MIGMSAFVVEKLCQGCQRCINACPNCAIRMLAGLATVDPENCTECEECIEVCMHGAITFRRDIGVEQKNG